MSWRWSKGNPKDKDTFRVRVTTKVKVSVKDMGKCICKYKCRVRAQFRVL